MRTSKYQGIDAIQQWHNDRSKSSMSEAFRDAEYASPITKFKSDTIRTVEFVAVASVYALAVAGAWGILAVCWWVIQSVVFILTK